MRFLKKLLLFLLFILFLLVIFIVGISTYNLIRNDIEKDKINIPGDKINIYDEEYIHAVKSGNGKYTIVLLPGMGTPSPYYDYYKLNEELSKKYTTIVIEPFGYGFSKDIDKERTLDNYEYELSKVLDYYHIKDNIILLGHSYSGISNLNYANKHNEVKGIVCLDCTVPYQIEKHVENGHFNEDVPKAPKYYSWVSTLGITRFAFSTILKSTQEELISDIPTEYQDAYKYFLYNKTLNKTIVNEINDIYYNQLDLFNSKYRDNLNVLTLLASQTIEEMKEYKDAGDFYHDWEEMHYLMMSNPSIQKIYTLDGDHYIHHGNSEKISEYIDEMIKSIK